MRSIAQWKLPALFQKLTPLATHERSGPHPNDDFNVLGVTTDDTIDKGKIA